MENGKKFETIILSPASLKKTGFRILGPGVVGDVDKWGYHLMRAGWVLVYRLDSDVDMEMKNSGIRHDAGFRILGAGSRVFVEHFKSRRPGVRLCCQKISVPAVQFSGFGLRVLKPGGIQLG